MAGEALGQLKQIAETVIDEDGERHARMTLDRRRWSGRLSQVGQLWFTGNCFDLLQSGQAIGS